jgi:hypothetical protein
MIKISCKAINGGKFYPVEACPHNDPTAPWVQVSVDSKCRQTITGLTPRVEHALRIAAKGAAGQSPWGVRRFAGRREIWVWGGVGGMGVLLVSPAMLPPRFHACRLGIRGL